MLTARGSLVDLLSISRLPRKPDFVIVSGDITIKGDRQGMDDFKAWLFTNIEANNLTSPERIVRVPGNHDVT
jgi:3',5'-cyclic AMP phosphodiesterase CpdA